MSIDTASLTAVILAGGRATRMGGNDKGLLAFNGRPMAALIAGQLTNQVDKVILNANRNLDAYRDLGFDVVEDDLGGFQGPLAGMLVALKQIDTDWLLTLPCDGPFVDNDYVSRMVQAVVTDQSQLAVASDGERLQPVYALIHRDLISSLTGYLESGERKIDRWYATVGFSTVDFGSDCQMFTNVNTPEQLQAVAGEQP